MSSGLPFRLCMNPPSPLLPTTRWHGINKGIRLAPHAVPTGRGAEPIEPRPRPFADTRSRETRRQGRTENPAASGTRSAVCTPRARMRRSASASQRPAAGIRSRPNAPPACALRAPQRALRFSRCSHPASASVHAHACLDSSNDGDSSNGRRAHRSERARKKQQRRPVGRLRDISATRRWSYSVGSARSEPASFSRMRADLPERWRR